MNILKAKVTKDNTLEAMFKNENGDTVTIDGKNIVHKDLTAAFTALIPHFAFLCEQRESYMIDIMPDLPDTIYENLEVTGYSVGGSDSSEGATLTGKRFLKSSKILNLNSPFTMFSNENEEYKYAFELHEVIQNCNFEVEKYLFEKKWAIVQQDLPFDGDANSDTMPFPDHVSDNPLDELVETLAGTGAALTINGKKVKQRRPRQVKENVA